MSASLSDFDVSEKGTRRATHGEYWSAGWKVSTDGRRIIFVMNEDQISRWISFYEHLILAQGNIESQETCFRHFLNELYSIKGFTRMHRNLNNRLSI